MSPVDNGKPLLCLLGFWFPLPFLVAIVLKVTLWGEKSREHSDTCAWECSVWMSAICLLLLFLFYYEYWSNFQPCNGVLTKSPSEFSLVLPHAWLEALLLTLKYNISIWNIKLNNFQAIKCRNKNFMATEQHLWLANAPVTSVMDFIQTFILMKIGWTLKCSDAWKKKMFVGARQIEHHVPFSFIFDKCVFHMYFTPSVIVWMCMNCTDVNAVGEFFFFSLKIYFVILHSFSSFRIFFQWAVIFLYFVPVNFLQFMLGLDVGCFPGFCLLPV